MEKKYLSDCIRYTMDIAPYPFIQIYSGVGSGKNTFVDALAKGYEESQPDGRVETLEPKRVLCITSRRAKVDELKNAEDAAYGAQVLEYEHLDYVEDLDSYFTSKRELSCDGIWGTIPIYQRSIACTNAAIERYLEKHYRADKAEDFLWNRFDIIVVDEAHAVVADASYQTAPYYVHSLINKTLKMNAAGKTNCKVIVMTGSPQILADFRLPKNGHAIDLMDRCVRVEPKHVLLADKAEVMEDMQQRLAAGEKVIYFANRVSTVLNLYRNAFQEYRNEAAVSFSADDELDKQEKENREILERRDEIQAYIAENTLPKKAVHPRRIAVVGGGAAGMEAAREAVECGHTVEIFEKSKVLGGELNAAGAHAFKEEIHQLRDWYIAELKEKNVPIHMETEFTPDMADSGKYDTVILAVGATPIMPASIEGVEKAISAVELLENHSDVGETVVVVGGGMVGCETAVDLSKAGKKVTLVEALPAVLSSEYVTTAHKMMLQDMMEDQKIEIMAAHKIVAVTDEGAVVEPTDGGERMTIPADKVVLSIGLKPNPSMALDLVGRGVEIYEIGSARRAGNVITAIHDAFNVVYNFE